MLRRRRSIRRLTFGSDGGLAPLATSEEEEEEEEPLLRRRRITVLQREGELLLIPPRWWHQTYHLEPSVALAGQYLNSNNEERVRSHVLSWCGVEQEKDPAQPQGRGGGQGGEAAQAPRERVQEMLRLALAAQHGEVEGAKLFERLLAHDSPAAVSTTK